MRLNKYLAQNLQISRRNADEKIAAGHVKINNEKASVGTIVNEHDVVEVDGQEIKSRTCLLYTSPSPRDVEESRMPSSA